MNIDAKALLNQKNYILKVQRITTVEIDEIKENISPKIGVETEDYTNEVNGDKMDKNVIEHQKRDQENENTDLGKVENNKHPSAEGDQHTVKNKLKEDLQIMWHKLPKLKTNSKFIKLQEEINGVIEELLEEDKMNITDINNLITLQPQS